MWKIIVLNFSTLILISSLNHVVYSNSNGTDSALSKSDETKIVGASQSKNPYNYMISLQVFIEKRPTFPFFGQTNEKQWVHNCGGSIINQKTIVTAAHCVNNVPVELMSVVVGTNDLSKPENGMRYFLMNYTMHPEYVELEKYDIAVLHLNDTMEYTDLIQPIELSDEHVGGGVSLLLTGWGFTTPPRIGDTPRKLREAQLTSMTNKQCNDRGMPAGDTEICTYERPFKGACGGDSGGPLVENRTLVGIVSYGSRLCAIGYPDVFTRASVLKDWINENTTE